MVGPRSLKPAQEDMRDKKLSLTHSSCQTNTLMPLTRIPIGFTLLSQRRSGKTSFTSLLHKMWTIFIINLSFRIIKSSNFMEILVRKYVRNAIKFIREIIIAEKVRRGGAKIIKRVEFVLSGIAMVCLMIH